MKKSSFKTFCVIVSSAVVAFLVLVFGFKRELCAVLESLSEAIFTGIVFSIPGYVVMLINERRSTFKDMEGILLRLLEISRYSSDTILVNFMDSSVENNRVIIVELYKRLGSISADNYLANKERIETIRDYMFDYCREVCELRDRISSNEICVGDKIYNEKCKSLRKSLENCADQLKAELKAQHVYYSYD